MAQHPGGPRDPGHAAVVAVVLVAFALLGVLAVGRLAARAADAARARTAADAAALAGVTGGPGAARRAAVRNDARLVGYAGAGTTVVVRACVRHACASASASLVGSPGLP